MANINDIMFNALGDQGFAGHLNDRLKLWLRANGATSANLDDCWHEMIAAQGITGTFHVNDGWFALLGTLGYTGSLSDREIGFWKDGGTFGPPEAPPGQVMDVDGQPAIEGLDVTWDELVANPSVTSYTLEYRISGPNPWNPINVGNVTFYELRGLTVGVLYDVRVYATNALGDGPPSDINTGTPIGLIPSQVTGVVVTSQLQALGVTWNAATGTPPVTNYTVQYRVNGSPTWINQVLGNVTSTAITGLVTDTVYNVRVFATNAAGDGLVSAEVNQTTFAVPAQVTGLVLTSGLQSISASWSATTSQPVTLSYTIEWRPQGSPTFTNQNVGNVTTFDLTGLATGQIYEVRVFATNIAGNGAPSAIGTQTTFAVPTVVLNLTVTPDIVSLIASWSALTFVPAVTSYTVEWKTNAGSVWSSQNVGLTGTYTILGLVAGTLYNVRVYATNIAGNGPATASVNGTPLAQPNVLLHYAEFNAALNSMYRTDTTPWAYMSLTPSLTGTGSAQASAYHFGKKLLAVGVGLNLNVYSTTTLPFTKLGGITNPANTILKLEFDLSGEFLAVATGSGQPSYIYTTATWARRALGITQDDSLAMNGIATKAVCAVPTGMDVWDISLPTPVQLTDPVGAPTAQCYGADFFQDILAVCGTSVPCRLFNMATNTLIGNVPGMTGTGLRVCFNNAGTRIAINTTTMFRIYDCTDILNPGSWVNLAISGPPALVADQNYSLAFSRLDTLLIARDMTDPDQAIAFDMTQATISRLPAFDIFRRNSFQQACVVEVQTTLPALPATPVNLVVTAGALQLVLTWNAITDPTAVGVAVQYKLATATTWTTVSLAVVATHTITGLLGGEVYNVRIATRYSLGYGHFTTTANGTPIPQLPTTWVAMTPQGLNSGSTTALWRECEYSPVNTRWMVSANNGFASRSDNKGVTWAAMPLNLGSGGTNLSSRGLQVNNAGVAVSVWANGFAGRTIDNGVNWTALPQGLNSGDVSAQWFGLTNNGTNIFVAVANGGRASRSIDSGATWTALPQGLNSGNTSANFNDVDNNGTTFIAVGFTHDQCARSTDSGATWAALAPSTTVFNQANCITYDAATNTWLIGANGGYVLTSTNDGVTWTTRPQGLGLGFNGNVIEADSDGFGRIVIVGTAGFAAYTTNGGASWTQLPAYLNSGASGATDISAIDNDKKGTWMAVLTDGRAARSFV